MACAAPFLIRRQLKKMPSGISPSPAKKIIGMMMNTSTPM
jgi:hypothetical protein